MPYLITKKWGYYNSIHAPGPSLQFFSFSWVQAWSWQEIHLAEIVWFAYSFIPAKLQAPRGPKPLTVSGTPSISCFKFTHLLTLQVHFLWLSPHPLVISWLAFTSPSSLNSMAHPYLSHVSYQEPKLLCPLFLLMHESGHLLAAFGTQAAWTVTSRWVMPPPSAGPSMLPDQLCPRSLEQLPSDLSPSPILTLRAEFVSCHPGHLAIKNELLQPPTKMSVSLHPLVSFIVTMEGVSPLQCKVSLLLHCGSQSLGSYPESSVNHHPLSLLRLTVL